MSDFSVGHIEILSVAKKSSEEKVVIMMIKKILFNIIGIQQIVS